MKSTAFVPSVKTPAEDKPAPRQRTEFRVVCCGPKGDSSSELTWMQTNSLDDARKCIQIVEPKIRSLHTWLIYEVEITEVSRIVYEENISKTAKPKK
jgi:hypothetical protein